MPAPLGPFSVEEFLADYWQKKPCLVRNAFPNFEPEIDGDDLAGLACEPMAEARIISGAYPEHNWRLQQGPFEESDFARLPETGWTLLVQDVEKHYPPLFELLEQFSFLPTWRLDDLMISWAAPGHSPWRPAMFGCPAPAAGIRRIGPRVGRPTHPALLEHCELNVLCNFSPEQEWTLEAGDMLYLPPGVAHHGVAVTAGMTWSIGARAPDAADLLMALGESLAGDTVPRYADPDLSPSASPGEIDEKALERLRALMAAPLQDDDRFRAFAASFLSRFRLAHEPAPPEGGLCAQEVAERLHKGELLFRNPWSRLAWVKRDKNADLLVSGQKFTCTSSLAIALCASQEPSLPWDELTQSDIDTLTQLIVSGHLLLAGQPE